MAAKTRHTVPGSAWDLAAKQHGVVSLGQLYELGLTRAAVRHRVSRGRLHSLGRGVFAVGRPEVGRLGRWMAAVLSCGPTAVLSHGTAAALWGIRPEPAPGRETNRIRTPGGVSLHCTPIDVSVRTCSHREVAGVRLHRRLALRQSDVGEHEGIPVTTPTMTLVDIAAALNPRALERAVNQADTLGLVDTESLLEALDGYRAREGVQRLRSLLVEQVFLLTDSELERRFLRLVEAAGLPLPRTGVWLNGFKVDFFWPALGLVVETDGLRYHRTPGQQARDSERDQAHAVAGLSTLRFTHAQVRYKPEKVRSNLARVVRRLEAAAGRHPAGGP
jgi:very-short-patch-repair endonuclease